MQLFTAKQYLKIDIANHFGLDKEDWDVRLQWFEDNAHRLDELIDQADEPALYYAAVKAWRHAEAGVPTGFMISLDATSSGLQLLACLTGDRKAAEICNVVNTGHRRDAYGIVYKSMCETIGEEGKISRGDAKDAVMTSLYGSKAVPKQVFGEGGLLNVFYDTMEELAPAAWELNEYMLDLWNPEALSHEWVLPDNFHVKVKVMTSVAERFHFLNEPFDAITHVNAPMEGGRSLGANTIHSLDGMIVREITRRCDYDPAQVERINQLLQDDLVIAGEPNDNSYHARMVKTLWAHYEYTGYLSARIMDHLFDCTIHLVDKAVIRELLASLPDKPFKVVSIHDCFRVHPNYGNDLRKQYNLQLTLIAKSDILSSFISQLTGKEVNIGKLDERLFLDILETNYALS